ncbi:MAG TPA: hypothetical protein DDZ76_03065, partial [Xanthomonadales bacterium]|nr:hypothetical protein [Xanthomonadales bacterium]
TLLRMVAGLDAPSQGRCSIEGARIVGPGRDRGMVFQSYTSFPWLTVRQNVEYGLDLAANRARKPRGPGVDAILERVGLARFADHYPSQLSGGMRQRVAIARALANQPKVLLMDEPFGALDAQTRGDMQTLLHTLHRNNPCLIVFVTHDVTEALMLGDRVVVLSTQPARIADDFRIVEPRPRSSAWQRSSEAVAMEERILDQLHNRSAGRGTLSVTI